MILIIGFSLLSSYILIFLLTDSYIQSLKKEIKTLKHKLYECNQERYFGKKK